MGNAPERLSASRRSKALSFSDFCSVEPSADDVSLLSRLFCDFFVQRSPVLMICAKTSTDSDSE